MFCGENSSQRFCWLGEGRYQIVKLIGKGGYSEVYKAFDLDLNWGVACKIHTFDNQWSDAWKMTYMRYAIRETEIHKDLHHPRIV